MQAATLGCASSKEEAGRGEGDLKTPLPSYTTTTESLVTPSFDTHSVKWLADCRIKQVSGAEESDQSLGHADESPKILGTADSLQTFTHTNLLEMWLLRSRGASASACSRKHTPASYGGKVMIGRISCQCQKNQTPECAASRTLRPLPTQPTARVSKAQTLKNGHTAHFGSDCSRTHCATVQGATGMRYRRT